MTSTQGEIEQVLSTLLADTAADRVTLRVDRTGYRFPVVAEVLREGVHSIRGDSTFDLRKAASSARVLETGAPLIQDDCETDEYAPPPEFVALYGVRAQMLGPIVSSGRTIGIVSVHAVDGPRTWKPVHVSALTRAVESAGELLNRDGKEE